MRGEGGHQQRYVQCGVSGALQASVVQSRGCEGGEGKEATSSGTYSAASLVLCRRVWCSREDEVCVLHTRFWIYRDTTGRAVAVGREDEP